MSTRPAHHLSVRDARRIAVRAQLLARPRPDDLLETVRHLTAVQADPTQAVARSADLVMWGRLGSAYRLGGLDEAVAAGQLIELQMRLRPAEDLALFRAEMAAWPGTGALTEWQEAQRDWVAANDDCRRDVLQKLHDEGPLPSSELPDTTLVPWESSGWTNDRNVRMLLGLMVRRGEVAVAGHEGRDTLWDLSERVYPDVEPVPLVDAFRIRNERRLRSLGIARATSVKTPEEPDDLGAVGESAHVEGVRGTWRLDPSYLDCLDCLDCRDCLDGTFDGRTVLLSPLDRLVYDRKRMADLFDFDYQLEMYKPAARRRWGYWALPILHGDRLVGKVDATAERDRGVLRVDAIHEDRGGDGAGDADGDAAWPAGLRVTVEHEVNALADWLGLEVERA